MILMLHYNLLTAILPLIIIFRIYDQNDKCFHTQRVLITLTSQEFSTLGKGNWSNFIDRSGARNGTRPLDCLNQRQWPLTVPHMDDVPKSLLTFFGNIFLGKAFKPWLLKGLCKHCPVTIFFQVQSMTQIPVFLHTSKSIMKLFIWRYLGICKSYAWIWKKSLAQWFKNRFQSLSLL